jgi:DNA replication protein DnaC
MSSYAKTDLLILDDWGLAPFTAEQHRDMLELLADAILDRLVHNAYRINL